MNLINTIKNLIKIGKKSGQDDVNTIKVDFLGKTGQKVLLISPYGIQAKAPNDTLVILLSPQAQEDNLLGYETDPVNRDNLDDGDLIFGHPSKITRIKIDDDDNLSIYVEGDFSIEDKHGNKYNSSSSGIVIEDVNGNDISMESGKIVFNGGNSEILQ